MKENPMDTVILALDGPESERALPAAEELATQFLSRIVVVHVNQLVPGARGGRFPLHADEDKRVARLHEIVADLRARGFEVDLEVSATSLAHPATIISRAAQRHQAGTVVLAARHHSPLVGMLTSSVSQRLLGQAPCPVLIVTPDTSRETFHAVKRPAPAAA
jgi:nucleotide-binding universal stress UspA family protein